MKFEYPWIRSNIITILSGSAYSQHKFSYRKSVGGCDL